MWFGILLCGAAALDAAPQFRIGFIAPLTGELSDIGTSCWEGAKLAVDEVNSASGLLIGRTRYTIVLVQKDDQGIPEKAIMAAQELINRENISAIIGPPLSATAIPVARLVERAKIPMITQGATNPEVTRGLQWTFRACFTDDFQAEVMARFARERLHASTAAILYDIAGTYNRTNREIFSRKFQELGGRILTAEIYITGSKDFKSALTRIKAAQPDVLFLPNYLNDLRIQFDQIRQLKLTTQVIGTDTMSFRDPLDIARSEGAYFCTHFSSEYPSDLVRQYNAAYQAAFHRQPTPVGALTYDAFGLLFEAARLAKSIEPGTLIGGLRGISRYFGVTGIMKFEGSHDPKKSVVIVTIRDEKPHFFVRIDP
jgi:branched-chain amino acid transport system substrate-binding protein